MEGYEKNPLRVVGCAIRGYLHPSDHSRLPPMPAWEAQGIRLSCTMTPDLFFLNHPLPQWAEWGPERVGWLKWTRG